MVKDRDDDISMDDYSTARHERRLSCVRDAVKGHELLAYIRKVQFQSKFCLVSIQITNSEIDLNNCRTLRKFRSKIEMLLYFSLTGSLSWMTSQSCQTFIHTLITFKNRQI